MCYTPQIIAKYFMLYISTSTTTIRMVLVQEYKKNQEHVVYYLSKSLFDSERHYSHF